MTELYARIAGTGGYLPERVLDNAELERRIDTTSAWIVERTGILERRVAADDELTSDLALQASRRALDAAGLDASAIDMVIVATTTPDRVFPATACMLQAKLGIHNGGPAFDVQAVCTGFVYALAIANQFIRAGQVKSALVVGAETLTRITDYSDRGNCFLWGDGAGAVVLTRSDQPGILNTHLHADGRHHDLLYVDGGASLKKHGDCYMRMSGNAVFKMAVTMLADSVTESLAAHGAPASVIDWVIPHQANQRILHATAKRLDVDPQRVVSTVSHHGNTSAASIPLAFDTAVRDGRIQRGQKIVLAGFGGGFTWGSALLAY